MFHAGLIHPFTMQLCGPTMSGKTSWIYNLLKEGGRLIHPNFPANRILFYEEHQSIYDKMLEEGLISEIVHGLPPLEQIREMVEPYKKGQGSLIILDDAYNNISETVETLFVQAAHHLKCSVILVTQRLFHQNRRFRTLALNSQYTVLFKSPRDERQIMTFASQISPHRMGYVLESFRRATKLQYSYLLCDFRQHQAPALMFRTRIFSHEFPMIAFLETS